MRRQLLINLLLLCLLLSAPRYCLCRTMAQANEAVHFEIESAEISARSRYENVFPTWMEGKTWHKYPSGPNPVGNHHPPSKQ